MSDVVKKTVGPKKPTFGYLELASCDGCSVVILNLDAGLLAIADRFDIKQFRIAQRGVWDGWFDFLLIEGTVTTEEDAEHLRELRKRSGYVISVGACAAIGGIPAMAPAACIQEAKEGKHGLLAQEQGPIMPIPVHKVIPIDASIHGCPITTEDVVRQLSVILAGGKPSLPDQAVCIECALNESGCLLLKGQACLGPVTRAGCSAVCTSNNNFCWGCRGLVLKAPVEALINVGKKHDIPADDFERLLSMANNYELNEENEGVK